MLAIFTEAKHFSSRYGNTLVQMCSAFKNADTELAHRILRVKASWVRTSHQLGFLCRIAKILPTEYLELQDQTLKVLQDKLEVTVSTLESLVIKGESPTISQNQSHQQVRIKRTKYALLEGRLNKAIDDLETWQGIFDPSWYLIIKAAIPQIDEELVRCTETPGKAAISPSFSLRNILKSPSQDKTPIWLKEDGITNLNVVDIPFSSAKLAQRLDGSRGLILESLLCPASVNPMEFTGKVRDLARKLSCADSVTFGLLNCKGVVKQADGATETPSFIFVFRIPDGLSEPTSLRSMLLLGDNDHSLSDRFMIASQLAESVCYMHTFGFVHKNVRPENILLLKGFEAPTGHAYLVGFEHFRSADGSTSRLGDSVWERNLYRHPRRQGEIPEEKYIMQHDIYSLGVCMLELGLWQSFVDYNSADPNPCPSSALGLSIGSPEFHDPSLLKDHLLSMARSVLPRRMGTKYTQVVETCLTCLDPDNTDFGGEEEFQDADGILVGVRYIEKVSVAFSTDPKAWLTFLDSGETEHYFYLAG